MKPIKRKGRSYVELKDGKRVTPIEDSKSRKGDIAELCAFRWLWDQGYEVFKNLGCSGAIDLIAFKNGDIKLIDVKTLWKRKKTSKSVSAYTSSGDRTEEQKNLGVQFLACNPITNECRFINHKS